jgi:ABC-type transport system involved in cytochrome bd biosynthesis fused ATPase/permease subunit
VVGIGFMVALFTVLPKAPGHAEWSQAFLALPPVGAGCIVAAVILGLLERVSSFFPSFALSSCYTIVLASFVSVIVFAFRWDGALIVLWAVYLVEILIAYAVLRAIASRMARRRG